MIGLNSSFPVAKRVLLMADESTREGILVWDEESIDGKLGNSAPLWPASLNLPFSELISIPYDDSSIKKVSG